MTPHESEQMGAVSLWVQPSDLPLFLSILDDVLDLGPHVLEETWTPIHRLAKQIRFQIKAKDFLEKEQHGNG